MSDASNGRPPGPVGQARRPPAGTGGGDAGRPGDGAGHGWLVAAVITAVVVIAAGSLIWLRFAHSTAGTAPSAARTPSAGPSVAVPSGAPMGTIAPVDLFAGPGPDPFTGTPADGWANGAAGIAVPAAKPAGPYTAAQVAYAYATTRKLLIAGFLDRQTLLGGAPTAFADLLTRQQRTQFLAGLNTVGMDKSGNALSTRTWVASFAPGSAALVGSVIKVNGTMRARAGTGSSASGLLLIHVNYRFVYPIEPPGMPPDWMRVVVSVIGDVEFGDWPQASTTFEPWVDFANSVAGVSCSSRDGYNHPVYPGSMDTGPQPTGAPVDPYSMDDTPVGSGCQAVTRT